VEVVLVPNKEKHYVLARRCPEILLGKFGKQHHRKRKEFAEECLGHRTMAKQHAMETC
jgi:hypothetical protein